MGSLMRRSVLQLNASLEAIRIISAKRALTLITKGKALTEVSTGIEIYPGVFLPSVIRLRHYARVPHKRPIPSRRNIFVRDGNRCLYCGAKGPKVTLELEHVIPRSRGGTASWDNLVSACHECNQKKGNRTPEEANMRLLHRPLPATVHTNRFVLKQLGAEIEEWSKYLWTSSEGDKRYQFN
jgi:hypothetical protein